MCYLKNHLGGGPTWGDAHRPFKEAKSKANPMEAGVVFLGRGFCWVAGVDLKKKRCSYFVGYQEVFFFFFLNKCSKY